MSELNGHTNGHTPGFQMPARVLALEFAPDSAYHGAVVRCHRNVTLHRALTLQGLARSLQGFVQASVDVDDEAVAGLEEAARIFGEEVLLSWNLLDDDGEVLPCTPEAFLEQPADFVAPVLVQWIEAVMAVPVPLAAASPNGSPLAAVGTMPDGPSPSRGNLRKRRS